MLTYIPLVVNGVEQKGKQKLTIGGLLVLPCCRFLAGVEQLGPASATLLHAIGLDLGTLDVANRVHLKVLKTCPYVFTSLETWQVDVDGGPPPSIWSPLLIFREYENGGPGSARLHVTVDLDRRAIRVHARLPPRDGPPMSFLAPLELGRLTAWQEAFTERPYWARPRLHLRLPPRSPQFKMEMESRRHSLRVAVRTAMNDMLKRDGFEAVRANGCVNVFIMEHRELFDFPLRLLSGTLPGSYVPIAFWCLELYLLIDEFTAIYHDAPAPIRVPSQPLEAWRIIAAFRRESPLKHYIVSDHEVDNKEDFIDIFMRGVRAGVTTFALSHHGDPDGRFLPLLGWACAYLTLISTHLRTLGP
jgi:hypothetical protein